MAGKTQARAIAQYGNTLKEETVTLPDLEPHQVLVRVHYAALNPTDMLAFDLNAFGDGAVLGCDFSGTVQEVGSEVTQFAVGDRIAAFTWGGEIPGVGAYSELCIADERIAFKVPNNITLEQAATIPLAATTAFLALFSTDCLGLDQKTPPSDPVMVLGGSTSVGSFAIQIATRYGIQTVSTASEKNFAVVREDGVKSVFDYHDSSAVQKICDQYPKIDTLFDTIGSPASAAQAEQILGSRSSKFCTVRPGKVNADKLPSNVDVRDVFVFTTFPKEHSYRGKFTWPINHQNHDLGKQFNGELYELISSGKVKPRPIKSLGKLDAGTVKKALDLNREGKLSNEKVCFTVHEGN